ncbi:probable receptor-like protein kinase [Tanacetum coccineum]
MNSILCLSLIVISSLLSLVSSQTQYALPDHYFINCGSKSDISFAGRMFVGDDNNHAFVSGGEIAVQNNSPTTVYETARVFDKKTSYNLEADNTSTFVMVRLHFSPFSTNEFELRNSIFDVEASGFKLLSNFKVENTSLVKDFIIPIGSERKFTIEFTPSRGSTSAFVNAIEAFTTPNDIFRQATLTRISPNGKNGETSDISTSYAFNPIYRINVGGQMINFEGDRLRRIWTPDDPYIFNSEPATNSTPFNGSPTYNGLGSRIYDAPEDVYKTAKQLNNTSVNVTWNFEVDKNAMYLVRAHFCDIISKALFSRDDAFNFFVYTHYKDKIEPGNKVFAVQVPFYNDYVVDSDESGFLNISIGAIRENNQIAFLNGVEIMELVTGSGVVGTHKKGKKNVYIVVGCVVGGVALVLILLVLGFLIGSRYGKKPKPVTEAKSESNAVPSYGQSSYTSINIDFTINHPSPIPNLNLNLKFAFADILTATNNFDEKLMIGKGGFGKVYKGTLPDGMIVAVKRGEKGHGQGRPEFVTEIMVLSKIRHRHLVTLIGYCDEKSEMILVYEFMKKGTLQDHLYDTKKDLPKLSWTQRLEICISATRGLHYLHTGSDAGIIHRDVKSTNILLNENYVAKVADFGISRLDNVEEDEISDIKGSFGYLDPEYIRCMKLTQKSDVYSFGVVLLEVLCARPALDNTLPPREANLADWAIKQIHNGKVEEIIDPFLLDTINPNSLRKFLETVERCLKDTGDERPSMIDVLWDLEYALKLHQMVGNREPHEDSTMNTSLQLPMSMIQRLPSNVNDDSEVIDSSASSFPSESQVFSQLKMDEAR